MTAESLWVGVDTGISGAAALVSGDYQYIDHVCMTKDEDDFLDSWSLYEKLSEWSLRGPLHVWIEASHGRPHGMAVREFLFGKYYGGQGAAVRFAQKMQELQNLDPITVQLVHPSTWKAYFGLLLPRGASAKEKREKKKSSIQLAGMMLGLVTQKHDVAEASLIAAYGAAHQNE